MIAGTAALAKPSGDPGNGNGLGKAGRLTLSGHVDGLYPAATAILPVHIDSDFSFAVIVTTLEVTVTGDASGCPASMLTITPPPTGQTIGAHSSTTIPVEVQLRADAPDGCQDATLSLAYAASVAKA